MPPQAAWLCDRKCLPQTASVCLVSLAAGPAAPGAAHLEHRELGGTPHYTDRHSCRARGLGRRRTVRGRERRACQSAPRRVPTRPPSRSPALFRALPRREPHQDAGFSAHAPPRRGCPPPRAAARALGGRSGAGCIPNAEQRPWGARRAGAFCPRAAAGAPSARRTLANWLALPL